MTEICMLDFPIAVNTNHFSYLNFVNSSFFQETNFFKYIIFDHVYNLLSFKEKRNYYSFQSKLKSLSLQTPVFLFFKK